MVEFSTSASLLYQDQSLNLEGVKPKTWDENIWVYALKKRLNPQKTLNSEPEKVVHYFVLHAEASPHFKRDSVSPIRYYLASLIGHQTDSKYGHSITQPRLCCAC